MTTLTTDNARKIAGLTILRSEEVMRNDGAFIAIYGSPGSGKTTLAGSLAKFKEFTPILYVDVEGGMGVLDADDINSGLIDPVHPIRWGSFEDIRTAVIKDPTVYKTIVMDNMSEVLTLCKRYVCGDMDSPSQPEWGKITDNMLNMTRAWRDLSKTTGINIIMLAWDNPDKDENNRVKNNLYFTPALREQFPGILDIVGHIGSENGVRVLDFQWDPKKTQAKFRRALGSSARKIPEKIPYGLDNMPLGDILNVLRKGIAWPESKYPRRPQQGAASQPQSETQKEES